MKIDMTMDSAWGSCGKGGVTGWLAKRNPYDTVVCAYGTQAGHTYNDNDRDLHMMVQQLPVGIICPTVKTVLIGPGSLIHRGVIEGEIERYGEFLRGKRLAIHEHAAVVEDYHADAEKNGGMTKIGSTAKGVGQAAIERILRDPENPCVAKHRFKGTSLEQYVVDRFEYNRLLSQSDHLLVEGAQGFSLSVYHGDYPYCTSRDVTPWQIAADCALPFEWAKDINVFMVTRTHPIRVNNRDGSSGPAYEGQKELKWEDVGQSPELTTVTKLPRRIFNFSAAQFSHAAFHCANGANTEVVLTFADYCKTYEELTEIMDRISHAGITVRMLSFGPDDSDIVDLRGVPLGSALHVIMHAHEKARS